MLLSEVRFAPADGDPAFVEIANTSASSQGLADATLLFSEGELQLAGAPDLPADGRLVVLFDGQDAVDGSTIHAPSGIDLPADQGSVELMDGDDNLLDRIAWGDAGPLAVASGPGGIVPDRFPEGSTIARAPGAFTPASQQEWVVSAVATPGEANPSPTVSVMLPISGAILDPSAANLSWYPVPGAATYHVQVATEATFANPALDDTVSEPQVNVASLAPGAYLWRVSAIGANGSASEFSESSTFELVPATTATLALAEDTPGKNLKVPLISQHKDTSMLLLELNKETGPHSWDADHGTFDKGDPADNMNCVLATVAMITAFYGGNLSQDRIGYDVLQRRGGNPSGPEGDLVYGQGIPDVEVSDAFRFALGGATATGLMTPDDMWETIVAQVDAGRPMAASNAEHAYVVTGYEVTEGRRLIWISDPWMGQAYRDDIDGGATLQLWLMPANPTVRKQEAGVTADSDGDGVVDFDETERFRTNPDDKDSDGDSLPDKQDIISGVFDPKYGYATTGGSQFGRDYDDDGNPTELDKDSDEGGCLDGEEDVSLNGHRDGSETWNFEADDDSCAGWRGTMSVTRTWTYSEGAQTGTATTTFNGVFVSDENPQHYALKCTPDNPTCLQIFLATGSISWSFQAQCGDTSDSGSGSFEAGTGFAVPEFDWEGQALFLRPTPDGKKLQYWGTGVLIGNTDQGEPYCSAGPGVANAEPYWFEILEDAADRQPYPGTIQTCLGHTFEIDIKATSISGTCRNKSVAGETDTVWTWSLVRAEPPGG